MTRGATLSRAAWGLLIALVIGLVWAQAASARMRTCSPFYLRSESGEIINPINGLNADQPYSTRQTCGACHDYDTITKGYHFQQGWDRIRDNFNPDMPWVLSDGMMGKQ